MFYGLEWKVGDIEDTILQIDSKMIFKIVAFMIDDLNSNI